MEKMGWVGSAVGTVLQFYVGVARLSLILPIAAWKVWRNKGGDKKNGEEKNRQDEEEDNEYEMWRTVSEAKDDVTKNNTHMKARESEGKPSKSVQGLVQKWNQIESGTPDLKSCHQNYNKNKNDTNQKFDVKRTKFESNNTFESNSSFESNNAFGTQSKEFYKQFYLMQDKYDKLEGKIKNLLDKHGKVVDTLEVIADSASELEKGIQDNYSSLKDLYTRIETISNFEDHGFPQDKNRKRNFWRSNQTLTSIGSYSLSQQDLRESKVSLSKDVSQSMDCLPLTSPALVSTLSRNQCSLSMSTSTLDVGAFSSLPPSSSSTQGHPWAILEPSLPSRHMFLEPSLPSSHTFQKEQSSSQEPILPSSHMFQKETSLPSSHMFQKEQTSSKEPKNHIFNKVQPSNNYTPEKSKKFYKEKDMLVSTESINFKEIQHLENSEGIKETQIRKFGSNRARRRAGLSKSQSEIQTGDKLSWMKNVFYRLSTPNLMSLMVKVRTSLEEDALDQATGTFKLNKQ